MKTYFKDINSAKRSFYKQKVDFEFPPVKVNDWTVYGFLNGDYLLLKGVNKKGRELVKKYIYERVYEKIREDYRAWIDDKFSF